MERYELENSREFKAAKELEYALNDYGWNGKRFAIVSHYIPQDPATDFIQKYG